MRRLASTRPPASFARPATLILCLLRPPWYPALCWAQSTSRPVLLSGKMETVTPPQDTPEVYRRPGDENPYQGPWQKAGSQ